MKDFITVAYKNARFEICPNEVAIIQELENELMQHWCLMLGAFRKLLTPEGIQKFYSSTVGYWWHVNINDYLAQLEAIEPRDLPQLCTIFLAFLFKPFGIRQVNNQLHEAYLLSRAKARSAHQNTDNALFKGTKSRIFVNAFSNHTYTFAFYLYLHKEILNAREFKSMLKLFYYSYLVEKYHSFCEIDAAFLRASEDFQYPALASFHENFAS